MDDRKGVIAARGRGLRVTGALGILDLRPSVTSDRPCDRYPRHDKLALTYIIQPAQNPD